MDVCESLYSLCSVPTLSSFTSGAIVIADRLIVYKEKPQPTDSLLRKKTQGSSSKYKFMSYLKLDAKLWLGYWVENITPYGMSLQHGSWRHNFTGVYCKQKIHQQLHSSGKTSCPKFLAPPRSWFLRSQQYKLCPEHSGHNQIFYPEGFMKKLCPKGL